MIHYKNHNTTVFQSMLYQTNSTLIITDDLVLIVDPTWLPAEVDAIRQEVDRFRGERPLYLLFTHPDYDHILGYQAFPDAQTIGHIGMQELDEAIKQATVDQIIQFDQKYYIQRRHDIIFPHLDHTIDHDGQTLEIGNTRLMFYLASGHTSCDLFCVVEPLDLLIAGDYLSDIEFPYIYHSSYEYEKTLQKVDTIFVRHSLELLIPGHGNVTSQLNEMKRRQTESFRYIHLLREAVQTDQLHLLEQELAKYDFPHGMRSFQEGNVELVRNEGSRRV